MSTATLPTLPAQALHTPSAAASGPVVSARGQVSLLAADDGSAPRVVVCRGGYVSPAIDGLRCAGATFSVDDDELSLRIEDHAANQMRLATLLPSLGEAMKPQFRPGRIHGWAGLRCTLPDRLPALGPVHPQRWPGVWMVSGMGARGISLAVMAGELCAAWLENEPLPLAPSLARHLMTERFSVQTAPAGSKRSL